MCVPAQMYQRSIQSLQVSTLVALQKAQPMTAAAIAVKALPGSAAKIAPLIALEAPAAVAAAAGKAALWTVCVSLHHLTLQLH